MKNFLIYCLFITLSIIVNSCEEGFKDESTTITSFSLVLTEVTAVPSLTTDTTPNYTFSSNIAGTSTYGGSCSSSTTNVIQGNNTITLDSLSDGTYSDCTITVDTANSWLINSLTMTSFTIDSTADTLLEVTAVTTPTNDTTPNYTFSTNEAGTLTYGGSCSSSTTSAISGNNTITLDSLSDGTYSDCTITFTNSSANSITMSISSFVIDTTAPTVTQVTAVTTPTKDTTPNYTFSTNEAGTITYGGSCSSGTTSATSGNNTITLVSLSDGTYSNCTIIVTDSAGNASSALSVSTFVVDTTAPTVSSISTTADNQSLVTITDNITVTFSEAMEPSYVTTSTSDAFCAGTIRVSSDNYSTCVKMSSEPVSSNSNRTFTLDPYDNLTVGSTYLTRVTTGVKDTAGNAMSSQYDNSTGFAIVDLTAPTVSSVSTTADNQSSVAITDNITVTFSEAMDNTTVTTNTDNTTCYGSLELSSDNFSSCVQMSSAPASSSDNMTFTLDPYDNLTGGTTYKTRVTTGVKDTAGNALSSQYETSSGFTTLLPAPDNLSASGANNTIILTWNSVSGATSYTLYWDNVSGIDNSDTPITSITNDNYTHSNMDNGSIYYYKVAAVNSSGTGTLSSVASALLSSYVKDSASLSGHTFAITSAAMNWNNAKVQATALGGYLTTVNSKAENDWLTTRFRIQHGTLWIGANDIATTNTWVWDNGTTDNDNGLTDNICGSNGCPNSNARWADNTKKWNNGEPNYSGASCGYIWKTSGHWDDVACSNNKYAIIEFD